MEKYDASQPMTNSKEALVARILELERKGKTITEAKVELREGMDKGVVCPCCGQRVQMYKRKITGVMAHSIVLMYRHSKTEFMHVWKDVIKNKGLAHGDFAKLLYWKLIEPMKGVVREDGCKHTGMWRLTERGRKFVENRLTVPEYALVYNGKCYGIKGKQIGIFDTFGTKFNYNELMNGMFGTPEEKVEEVQGVLFD